MELLELLVGLLEPILEGLFEYVVNGMAELILRAVQAALNEPQIDNLVLASVGYIVLGIFFGLITSTLVPHLPSGSHRITVISAAITGMLISLRGRLFRWRLNSFISLDTLMCGFAFAFGVSLMRLLIVR